MKKQRVSDDSYRASKPNDPTEWNIPCAGLTKREMFAMAAMQGLLSNQAFKNDWDRDPKNGIKLSVLMADALLEELEKPTK